MTFLKIRVPECIEKYQKHIVGDFIESGETLWADLTVLRNSYGYGDVPIYTLRDDGETLDLKGYYESQKLIDMGMN